MVLQVAKDLDLASAVAAAQEGDYLYTCPRAASLWRRVCLLSLPPGGCASSKPVPLRHYFFFRAVFSRAFCMFCLPPFHPGRMERLGSSEGGRFVPHVFAIALTAICFWWRFLRVFGVLR